MENALEKLLRPNGQYMTGVLPDTRPPAEKEYDRKHEEVFGSAPTSYFTTKAEASKYVGFFPTQSQFGTSSCVAHTRARNEAIFRFLQRNMPYEPLGPMFMYRQRSNFPAEGMILGDADSLSEKAGFPSLVDLPTPQTEAEANGIILNQNIKNIAGKVKAGSWLTFQNPENIDNYAFAVNSLGIAASLLIYAQYEEWARETPTVIYPSLAIQNAVVRHNMTILPDSAFIDHSGKKYIIVQDSALFGGIEFRYLSEDFIKARAYGGGYLVDMETNTSDSPAKPSHVFSTDLTIGMSGPDVLALQQFLQYYGYMPNVVNGQLFSPTSYYGGMTKTAVAAFQSAHQALILKPAGLTAPTGYFGPSTRGYVNKVISNLR